MHFYYCIEGKKGFDFMFGHFFEMTFVVEGNQAPYPLHVIFLSAVSVMFGSRITSQT